MDIWETHSIKIGIISTGITIINLIGDVIGFIFPEKKMCMYLQILIWSLMFILALILLLGKQLDKVIKRIKDPQRITKMLTAAAYSTIFAFLVERILSPYVYEYMIVKYLAIFLGAVFVLLPVIVFCLKNNTNKN